MRIPGVLLATGLALAGCATSVLRPEARESYAADGAVTADIVEAEPEQRYQPVPGSRYRQPLASRENAKPVYPPVLLDRRLPPVVVVVRIVVDGRGQVERATLLVNDGDEPAFGEAVLAAVHGWTFAPLLRMTGDKIEPLPFTQDYRFVFRQVNGRAVVESATTH